MRTLVSVLFKKDLKEFDRLRKKLEKLGRQRDIIAHARWQKGTRPGSIKTLVMKSVNELKAEPHEFTVSDLSDIAKRIIEGAKELKTFLTSRGVTLSALLPMTPVVAPKEC